jgi:hypothetical protein
VSFIPYDIFQSMFFGERMYHILQMRSSRGEA